MSFTDALVITDLLHVGTQIDRKMREIVPSDDRLPDKGITLRSFRQDPRRICEANSLATNTDSRSNLPPCALHTIMHD